MASSEAGKSVCATPGFFSCASLHPCAVQTLQVQTDISWPRMSARTARRCSDTLTGARRGAPAPVRGLRAASRHAHHARNARGAGRRTDLESPAYLGSSFAFVFVQICWFACTRALTFGTPSMHRPGPAVRSGHAETLEKNSPDRGTRPRAASPSPAACPFLLPLGTR